MYVRPIRETELARAREIDEIAFGAVPDARGAASPVPESYEKIRAAFDDADRMTACLQLSSYCVRFDGRQVPMGGVGGVAALPDTRNRGNVNALFAYILREMYEGGLLFSMIYPSSHAYYRKLEYELTHFRHQLTLPTRCFIKHGIPGGRFVPWVPGEDDAPMRGIYDAFLLGTNLSLVRGRGEWDAVHRANARVKPNYTYIWYDDGNVPQAYFTCHIRKEREERILEINDYAWASAQGLSAIFGMLRGMCAQFRKMTWSLPDWLELMPIFPEPYEVEARILPSGMTRVVNARAVLSALRHPKREGSYTLGLRDPLLPENDGVFRVDFSGGEARVEKMTDARPDLRLDMRAFAQLAVGSESLGSLLLMRPDLAIDGNEETLRRVFHRRRVFLADVF